MNKADKAYANSLNPEWLKLSNKVLRAFPNSPRQKQLKEQLNKLPQFKTDQGVIKPPFGVCYKIDLKTGEYLIPTNPKLYPTP